MTSTSTGTRAPADGFGGRLIGPDDPGYDGARTLFNAMIDRRPALIAQCRDVGDVAQAIRYARARSLEMAVRGGGHGVAGRALSDGGLVVDLRLMNQVSVDPAGRTATVGGGATMRDLDRATEPYGLATTGGRVSTTGVGGFTLGGGNGWLDRRFGLACDNLVSVDLVTAGGKVVRASETENPELFWGLHGGGGNFGVATSFTFRLHPLRAVTAAKLLWPAEAGPDVVAAYRDWMVQAPDEVGSACAFLTAPPADFIPAGLVGRLACAVVVMYAGTGTEAREALRPVFAHGHCAELVVEVPYADWQCMNEDPPGYRNYWSADHLDTLPDEAIDEICGCADAMIVPSPSALVLIGQGGALAREGADTPLPWRRAPWHVARFGIYDSPADDERARSWAHDLGARLRPWSSGDVYLNFIGPEGTERVVAGLGADNLARLAALKRSYDPDNLFHLNHNIAPAGS
jgi:FAD/FMN-containing dehydrogenase